MIVSGFISALRRKYNDNPVKHNDVRTGDGSSTVYKTMFSPIKEGSFKLYVNNALQASSGYTIDEDTGDIVLIAATSNEINAQYQEVRFRDQHWLEIIQSAFHSLGDQFFKSVVGDTSGIALVKNQQTYDCPSSCIRMMTVLQSDDYTISGGWTKPRINSRYDRRSNKLILSAKPSKANYMNLSYLSKLTVPTATSDTMDIEDNWLELLDLKSGSQFLRSMANRVAQQGNATIEEGHLSISHLRQLANDNEAMYENLKRKLKPVMPASEIPFYVHGGGYVF